MPPDAPIDTELQQGPQDNIGQQQTRHAHEVGQQPVEHDEKQGYE